MKASTLLLEMGLEIPSLTMVASSTVEKLDWGKIDAIDIYRLKTEKDKSNILKDLLPQIIQSSLDLEFSDFGSEKNVERLRKVFQLSQLTLEILLDKLNELGSKYASMEANFAEAQLDRKEKETELVKLCKKLEFAKKELKQRKQIIVSNQNDIMNGNLEEYEQCPYCTKRFLARIYLLSHVKRRHQGLLGLNFGSQKQALLPGNLEVAPIPKLFSSLASPHDQLALGNELNSMAASFQQFLSEQQRKHLSPEPQAGSEQNISDRRRRSVHEAESKLIEKAEEVETRWKTVLAKLHFTKEDDLNEKIKKTKIKKEQIVENADKGIQCSTYESMDKTKQSKVIKVDKEIQLVSIISPVKKMEIEKSDKEIQCSPQSTIRSSVTKDTASEIEMQKLSKTLLDRQNQIDELRGILEKKSQENVDIFQRKLELTENSWKLKTQHLENEYRNQMEQLKEEFKDTLAKVEQNGGVKDPSRKPSLKTPSPFKKSIKNTPVPKPRNIRKNSPVEIVPFQTQHEYEEPIDLQKEIPVLEYSNSISSTFLETESNHSVSSLEEENNIEGNGKQLTEMDQVRTKILQDLDDQLSLVGSGSKVNKNFQLLEKDMSKALGRLKQSRQSLEGEIDNFATERIHLNQQANSFAHRSVLEDKLSSPRFPKSRRLNLVNTTAKKSHLTKMYQGLKRKGTSLKMMFQRKNGPSKQVSKKQNRLTLSTLFSKAPAKNPQSQAHAIEESEDSEEISDDEDFVMPMITKSRPIFEDNPEQGNISSAAVMSESEGSLNQNKQRKHLWKNSDLQRQAKEAIQLSKVPVATPPKSTTSNQSLRRRRSTEKFNIKQRQTSSGSSTSIASYPPSPILKLPSDDKTQLRNYVEVARPPEIVVQEETELNTEINQPGSTSEPEAQGDQHSANKSKESDSETSMSSGWDTNSYTPAHDVKLKLGFQKQFDGESGLQKSKPGTSIQFRRNRFPTAAQGKNTSGAKRMLGSWDSDSDRLI